MVSGVRQNPIRLVAPPYRCSCGKPIYIQLGVSTGKPEMVAYCRKCKLWYKSEPGAPA